MIFFEISTVPKICTLSRIDPRQLSDQNDANVRTQDEKSFQYFSLARPSGA